MSEFQQIGVIGNSVRVQSLPTPSAATFGDGNRFYTLIGTQSGYTTGHTYRTIITNDVYSWEDIAASSVAYDDLNGRPIINADLDNTDASTANQTVLYHHNGNDVTTYKKTSLYFTNGTSWVEFKGKKGADGKSLTTITSFSIATTDWSDDSTISPFKKKATKTVELTNNIEEDAPIMVSFDNVVNSAGVVLASATGTTSLTLVFYATTTPMSAITGTIGGV